MRYVDRAIDFFLVWAVVAYLCGLVMAVVYPPRGSQLMLGGIDLDWRYLPGATLGFLVGVYSWRASMRVATDNDAKCQPEAHAPTSHRQRWYRFLAGLAWATAVASLLSRGTQCTFPFAFAAVLGGSFVCGGLGLWWLTLWARQKDGRLGQFGVGSLLFLMVYAAIFFGTVRWIVALRPQADNIETFCICALVCLFLALISIPFVLGTSEAVLWAAVWFVNLPQVRRWIRGRGKDDRS
jgi:hypothetical protein